MYQKPHDELCLNRRYQYDECNCSQLLMARTQGYNQGYREGWQDALGHLEFGYDYQ